MNTAHNKRRQESRRKMEEAFISELQYKELQQITVTDICRAAKVNRSTFYANYIDIFDLSEAVQDRLEKDVLNLYHEEWRQGSGSDNFLPLFRHIKENPLFYKTYFKLNHDGKLRFGAYDITKAFLYYDNKNIDYHIEFFANGLNAVIKKWLQNDCKESPEEINSIIIAEYKGRN